jgi:hypothetical protein
VVGHGGLEPHSYALPWISLRCTNSPRGPSSNPASIKPRGVSRDGSSSEFEVLSRSESLVLLLLLNEALALLCSD